jgi:hypothetical protein
MFTAPNSPPVQAVVVTGHERSSSSQIINIALYNTEGDPMTAVTSEDMTEFVTNASLATTLDDYETEAAAATALGTKLTAVQAAAQGNSVAATVGALVTDFNSLLAKLRTAGILAP